MDLYLLLSLLRSLALFASSSKGARGEGIVFNGTALRYAGSSIYFLLEKGAFSAWHRLKSDEIWHYYDGTNPIDIYVIDQEGHLHIKTLGNPLSTANASFQVVIKAGDWFAAEVCNESSFALAGRTSFPGIEHNDYILANSAQLISRYPNHTDIINKLTQIAHKQSPLWTTTTKVQAGKIVGYILFPTIHISHYSLYF